MLHSNLTRYKFLYNKETQEPDIIYFGSAFEKTKISEDEFNLYAGRKYYQLRRNSLETDQILKINDLVAFILNEKSSISFAKLYCEDIR